MTKTQALELCERGEFVTFGVYNSGRAEETTVRAGAGKEGRRKAVVVRQTVVTDRDVLAVSEWLPDGSEASSWHPAPGLTKGKPCVIVSRAHGVEGGTVTVSKGRVEPLTDK